MVLRTRHSDDALRRPATVRSGFTLAETLVSVVILIGVLFAAGRIFSTTQQVTGFGEANSEILDTIIAVESQMRRDLENISREGFLVIRNVEVPNDIRGVGRPFLDPTRPADAVVRSDQLFFIREGVERIHTISSGAGEKVRPTGTAARIYYGHGFTLDDASLPAGATNRLGWDVLADGSSDRVGGLSPWYEGPVQLGQFRYVSPSPAQLFFDSVGSPRSAVVRPVPAREWGLVRSPVVLVDDDGPSIGIRTQARTRYLDENGGASADYGGALSYFTAFTDDPRPALAGDRHVLSSRADAAASTIDDIRDLIIVEDPAFPGIARPWFDPAGLDQRTMIEQQVAFPFDTTNPLGMEYPRYERRSPSSSRVDVALTNALIGANVSDIRFEWTYRDRTGVVQNASVSDNPLSRAPLAVAFDVPDATQFDGQPWFGLRDDDRDVRPLSEPVDPFTGADEWILNSITYPDPLANAFHEIFDPVNIEGQYAQPVAGAINVHTAVFGFNSDRPLFADPGVGIAIPPRTDAERQELGFTPWPDAIRVTMTVHDANDTLVRGREVQFVIDLPETGGDR